MASFFKLAFLLLIPLLFASSVNAFFPRTGIFTKAFAHLHPDHGKAFASQPTDDETAVSDGSRKIDFSLQIGGVDVDGDGKPDYKFHYDRDSDSDSDGDDKKSADTTTEEYETEYMGHWTIDNPNVGVAAMQLQLMPNDKVVWFDTTSLGDSARKLEPPGNCPINAEQGNKPDCFAHAVAYDAETGESRGIYMDGDPWCSSGNLWPNGDLVATGGTKGGFRSIRVLSVDDPNAQFVETKNALAENRWYASNQVLEDGSAVVLGGRDSYSYEIIPPNQLNFKPKRFNLPFLQETTEPKQGNAFIENNLYPFLYLMPNGNLFLFANNRAISFRPHSGQIMRVYPKLEGGSRNYPPSGMSALLPIKLTPDNRRSVSAEIVVCGGNRPEAFAAVDAKHTHDKVFMPALQDCHRLKITKKDSDWEREQDMPSPRTMGDLLHLPTGDLLMLNGAQKGTSGWEDAIDPNFTPVLYRPSKPMGQRFRELTPTNIARMYHSCSALLPDTKVLVAGSNPHEFYTFNVDYPTELRVEKFSPHYLDPELDIHRPVIVSYSKTVNYGSDLLIEFQLGKEKELTEKDVKVTMIAPPFTTHGFSQNQRLLELGVNGVRGNVIAAVAPPSGKVAPPGYYMLFVSNRGVPGKGVWVHID